MSLSSPENILEQKLDELVMAARSNDDKKVDALLNDAAVAPHVSLAVFSAVISGASQIISLVANRFGSSALHGRDHLALRMAARLGNLALFRQLLAHDSRIDARGFQALKIAQIHGHRQIEVICRNRGGGGGAKATSDDLMNAVREGQVDLTRDFLLDPELARSAGRAAIVATACGNLEIISLIAEICGPSALHSNDHLALRMAARLGNLPLFQLLLRHYSLVDARGGQALRLAIIAGQQDIVEECLKRGGALLTPGQFAQNAERITQHVNGPLVLLKIKGTDAELFDRPLNMVFGVSKRLVNAQVAANQPTCAFTARHVNDEVRLRLASMTARESSELNLLSGPYSYRVREVLPPSRLFVSLVHDPVEHVAHLFSDHIAPGEAGLKALGLQGVLQNEEALLKYGYLLKNHQARMLSGDPSLDPDDSSIRAVPPDVEEDDLQRIFAETTDNFVLLGQKERLEDSALILARQMGFPLTVMVAALENEPRQDGHVAKLDQATRARILELNAMDVKLHQWAGQCMDEVIAIDPEGFERDRQILHHLKQLRDQGETYYAMLQIEKKQRQLFRGRLDYLPSSFAVNKTDEGTLARSAYLDLMEDVLINRIYADPSMASWNKGRHVEYDRTIGNDWPETAHTMVGKKRLHNVRTLCEQVIREAIPGDFIETGVWRGGATILMRAVLHIYGDKERTVWVADSFCGVPPPDEELYPEDRGDVHFAATELGVSQAEVAQNFRKYDLLDRQVRFLPGLFSETLHHSPIKKLAILRLDGDMFESTMDALEALYDHLSVGGYVIIDDYAAVPGCKKATKLFREKRKIESPLVTIDWAGVYWRKTS